MSTYGDIGSRTAAYAASELLTRGVPYLVLERFGQSSNFPATAPRASSSAALTRCRVRSPNWSKASPRRASRLP